MHDLLPSEDVQLNISAPCCFVGRSKSFVLVTFVISDPTVSIDSANRRGRENNVWHWARAFLLLPGESRHELNVIPSVKCSRRRTATKKEMSKRSCIPNRWVLQCSRGLFVKDEHNTMIAFAYCQRSLRRLERKKQEQNNQRVCQQQCSNMQCLLLSICSSMHVLCMANGTSHRPQWAKLAKELKTCCCCCLVAFSLSSVRLAPRSVRLTIDWKNERDVMNNTGTRCSDTWMIENRGALCANRDRSI